MSDESADENDIFRRAMRDVIPLKSSNKVSLPPRVPEPTRCRRQQREVIIPAVHYVLSDPYQDTVEANTVLSFSRVHFSHKQRQAMKQGPTTYDGLLDLHGLTLDKARETLSHFIETHVKQGSRDLLIIHGKGGRHGEAPLLKNRVNHWLPQFPAVIAFHSAPPKQGGTGAVYVRLKRGHQPLF